MFSSLLQSLVFSSLSPAVPGPLQHSSSTCYWWLGFCPESMKYYMITPGVIATCFWCLGFVISTTKYEILHDHTRCDHTITPGVIHFSVSNKLN